MANNWFGGKKFDKWTEEECDEHLDIVRTPLTLPEKRFIVAYRFVIGWEFGRVCLSVVSGHCKLMTVELSDKPEL